MCPPTTAIHALIQENLCFLPICLHEMEVDLLDFTECCYMSKREIIECILEINRSAKPEFLAQFPKEELDLYLEHLMEIDLEDMALCA